jgi:hypothetical protein
MGPPSEQNKFVFFDIVRNAAPTGKMPAAKVA